MIRTLLVDDEPLANAGLRTLLARYADIDIVGEARGGQEAIRVIPELRPDLVFLDVQMPRIDGFGVLRGIEHTFMPDIVFVTAYEEFAVRAFAVDALDYLVKPVAAERLHDALERVRRRFRSPPKDQPRPKTAYASRIMVRVGSRQLLLLVTDVDWIQADDYCSIVHARGTSHVIRETLGSLAARLDPALFARVHRSAIVNIARIRELRGQRLGGLTVVLADGTTVAVSRSRRAELQERLR